MNIIYDDDFDSISDNSSVFQIYPNVFQDSRGYFTEVLKTSENSLPNWMKTNGWIQQMNRSSSSKYTVRGCHAQYGKFCQGKLVEALTEKIYDIITDSRPDSKTYGLSKIYILDPLKQNKLWVPRGFLHAFVVPNVKSNAIFQYFCDNVYNKPSEIGINPLTILPKIVSIHKSTERYLSEQFDDLYDVFENNLTISEKDKTGLDYGCWMASLKDEYDKTGILWYR